MNRYLSKMFEYKFALHYIVDSVKTLNLLKIGLIKIICLWCIKIIDEIISRNYFMVRWTFCSIICPFQSFDLSNIGQRGKVHLIVQVFSRFSA